jgi:hypothetical protein
MMKSNFSLLMESEELKEYLGEESTEMNLSDLISNMFAIRDSQEVQTVLVEDEKEV